MLVVVDTNVLVSGIFWAGTPGRVLDAWANGRFTLCVTPEIAEEYSAVIERLAAKCGRADLARRWQAYLIDHAQFAEATRRFTECRDPDDAMFVECALTLGAPFLVSGDDDLRTLHRVEQTEILSPSQFLERLEPQSQQSR